MHPARKIAAKTVIDTMSAGVTARNFVIFLIKLHSLVRILQNIVLQYIMILIFDPLN